MKTIQEPVHFLCACCGTECESSVIPPPHTCGKNRCLRDSYLKTSGPPYPWDVDVESPARWHPEGFEDGPGFPFYKNGAKVPPWCHWDKHGVILEDA